MGSVLRSFGAIQGNIWSVAPFIPVGPGENQCCPHKTRIFSESPNGPIFRFFLVVQNIVFDIIHSKIRPNIFFPYKRILTSCVTEVTARSCYGILKQKRTETWNWLSTDDFKMKTNILI